MPILKHNQLLLFAKYPEAGKVKTRLAETVGPKKAADIYRRMLKQLITQIDTPSRRYELTLYYTPEAKKKDFQKIFPMLKKIKPQSEGDLGERLTNAFANAFHTEAERVIVIGADCIEINQAVIEEAFRQLAKTDLVIAPAKDGGYTLLGMQAFHPQIFHEIAWSSEKVLQQTLERAEQLRLSLVKLPTLPDIDTYEDYLAAKCSAFGSF